MYLLNKLMFSIQGFNIKNEIQHMFPWNSVGIVAETRLTCLSLYQEWNPAHAFLEFCWHCCRRTLNVFVFTSRMKSITCFLGILLALLQKNAWRVCLYIKNEIQQILSRNSVGIAAEKRLTCWPTTADNLEWLSAVGFVCMCSMNYEL